jgi:disulfide bond formation protein DsbB
MDERWGPVMDIRIFLCASFVIAALACFFGAVRIVGRGAAGAATIFSGMGALSLAVVWMMWLGPWRYSEQGIFPMAVPDMSAPISPAASDKAAD